MEFWSEDNDGNCLVQDDGPLHTHLHGMVELWCEGDDGNCLVQGGPVHLLTHLHGMVELWCEGDDGNCLVQGGPVHLLHTLIACLRVPATSIVFLLALTFNGSKLHPATCQRPTPLPGSGMVIREQEWEVGTNPVRRETSLGERGVGIGIQLNCR